MKRSATAFALLALICSASFAQESETRERTKREQRKYDNESKATVLDPDAFKTEGKQIFSGPQPGEKLTAIAATNLAGDNKGKDVDPVTLQKSRPQIIIFQNESGVAVRGLYGLADSIGKIDKKTAKDLHVACVFLSDDESKITQFEKLFPKLMEMGIDSVSLSSDGRDGPGAYGLNRTVAQTIILAKDGKVTRNFAFPQGLLYSDPHVMGAVAELIEVDRETVAGWLAEGKKDGDRMRMRGGDERKSAVKRAFREKLKEFVEAGKITREEAGELHRAAFPNSDTDRRSR